MQTTLLIAAVILAVCTDTVVCIQCYSCMKSDDGIVKTGGSCSTPNFATSVITCRYGVTTCNYLEGTINYSFSYRYWLGVSTSNYVFRSCGQPFESGSECTPTSISIPQSFGSISGELYCTCTTNRCDAKRSPRTNGATPVRYIPTTSTPYRSYRSRTTTNRYIPTTSTPYRSYWSRTATTWYISTTGTPYRLNRARTTTPRTYAWNRFNTKTNSSNNLKTTDLVTFFLLAAMLFIF